MGYLLFLGLVVGGTILILVALRLTAPSRKGPWQSVVLLTAASGQAETEVWRSALRAAGVWVRVQNVGDFGWYGASSYGYELWVREKDIELARRVLGIG